MARHVEAVSTTIEIESYLKPKANHVAQVEPEQACPDAVIAAVQHKQDAIMGMLENTMSRLEKLEAQTSEGQSASAGNPGPRAKRPVVCHNCKQEGQYARGCAAPLARTP